MARMEGCFFLLLKLAVLFNLRHCVCRSVMAILRRLMFRRTLDITVRRGVTPPSEELSCDHIGYGVGAYEGVTSSDM